MSATTLRPAKPDLYLRSLSGRERDHPAHRVLGFHRRECALNVREKIKGAPPDIDSDGEQYLLKKLDDVRKECQWILGLGAVNVLGVVLKDGFGHASPALRLLTAIASGLQILTSMMGSMAWLTTGVDKARYYDELFRRLRIRYLLRNASVVLLGISLLMLAVLAWNIVPQSK